MKVYVGLRHKHVLVCAGLLWKSFFLLWVMVNKTWRVLSWSLGSWAKPVDACWVCRWSQVFFQMAPSHLLHAKLLDSERQSIECVWVAVQQEPPLPTTYRAHWTVCFEPLSPREDRFVMIVNKMKYWERMDVYILLNFVHFHVGLPANKLRPQTNSSMSCILVS
jgi:hypothetical protein